jgi:hypothetical protein
MRTRSILLLALMAVLLGSCATTQSHPRKCNGQRGTRTPMGVM